MYIHIFLYIKMSWINFGLKFLFEVLFENWKNFSLKECNDFQYFAGFINSLLSEPTEVAINQLLTHLPLLRPGNVECKQCYLSVIPELISHCVSTGQYTEQTQQLLSYTLIHPAITSQDRRTLTQWLRQLEDRISSAPIHNIDEYTHNTSMRWVNDLECQFHKWKDLY